MKNERTHSGPAQAIERTARGGCQYLTRGDGPLRECGEPATHKMNKAGGLIYCTPHGQFVQDALKRSRSRLEIRLLREEERR